MTANILSSELGNIIQEAKRKNSDIKNAAEQVLQELKALPATSESQLAADLRRRPHFIDPFLLACGSRNTKLTLSATSCLQRLIIGNGLAEERLKQVLEAFQECASIGLEVQLKILQCLPAVSQNYTNAVQGDLLAVVLQICTTIQQAKSTAVSSTASATLQQILSLLFDRVETDDESPKIGDVLHEIPTDTSTLSVRTPAYDAYRTLQDICLMIDEQPPQFVRKATLASTFGLELVEMVLLNHAEVLPTHPEQGHLLSAHVMPLINRILSERLNFAITVRAVRILCILIREHLHTVASECKLALGLLNHCLEADVQTPWRRAVAMEAFRVIYSSSEVLLDVYEEFDGVSGGKGVIQANLASFVRLAAEKPALIGLGQQSSTPTMPTAVRMAQAEQGVLEAEAAVGIIGSDYGVNETNVPGISTAWSSMKVSCLDQLDKIDGPPVPETYIYSLVLTNINGLSDALAKVVLPMAMQHQRQATRKARSPAPPESLRPPEAGQQQERSDTDDPRPPSAQRHRARSVFVNPLDLKEHTAHAAVATAANLINACWPAVLAASSTFFNAALDADFYRSLVRSFQKFAQIAGILRLATPRDALLTTLARTAVPPYLLAAEPLMSPSLGQVSPGLNKSFRGLMTSTTDSLAGSTTPDSPNKSRHSSLDASSPVLTQRNMMCLRALVHLAIALGPILDQGWPIVLENLQKANVLLAAMGTAATARDYRSNAQAAGEPQTQQSTLASEIAAVEGAVTKLFASTADYSSEAFKTVLVALCGLLSRQESAEPSFNLKLPPKTSKRAPSMSGLAASSPIRLQYSQFAIAKLGELAKVNMKRIAQGNQKVGWDLLMHILREIATAPQAESSARQMAADVLCKVAAGASITTSGEDVDVREVVQKRSFVTLKTTVLMLHTDRKSTDMSDDIDVHQLLLGSLRAILEHCGEAIVAGWDVIFEIIDSTFLQRNAGSTGAGTRNVTDNISQAQLRSVKLGKAAFASIQLVCSDFLDTLPTDCLIMMIDITSRFCGQQLDMNISLTAITLFWNISDHLKNRHDAYGPQRQDTLESITDTSSTPSMSHTQHNPSSSAWSLLLQRLAQLTNDSRADVRNGAMQVLFRTLDSSSDRITVDMWDAIFQSVLFRVLDMDAARQTDSRTQDADLDEGTRKALNQSSKLVIEGCERLFVASIERIGSLKASVIWHDLLERLASYLDCDSYELQAWVYTSISRILGTFQQDENEKHIVSAREVASLWARAIPEAKESLENDARSQDHALRAYIDTMKCVYAPLQGELQGKQVDIIVKRIQQVICASRAPPYTTDVDTETQLQSEALQMLGSIMTSDGELSPSVLRTLCAFVVYPYEQGEQGNGLTHVAFAKASMARLQTALTHVGIISSMSASEVLTEVFDALIPSIEKKYTWKKQGRDPALWRKATSTALAIADKTLQAPIPSKIRDEFNQRVLDRIIKVGEVIQHAIYDTEPKENSLLDDEEFDLAAFERYHTFVTPHLNRDTVSEATRLAHVAALHRTSTFHPSRFDDLSSADGYSITHGPSASPNASSRKSTRSAQSLGLGHPFPNDLVPRSPSLTDLQSNRTGLVFEPPFNPRIRMCYAALDHLFDVVSVPSPASGPNSGAQEPLLARTAFHFLIHRIAVPLKRYIADQPLRGRFPTPESQRLELLHIIDRLAKLECVNIEAGGSHDASGRTRKHLRYLAPFISKALRVVGEGDGDIKHKLLAVLDVVVGEMSEGRM